MKSRFLWNSFLGFHHKSFHISSFYRTCSETASDLWNYRLFFFFSSITSSVPHYCTHAWLSQSSLLNVLLRFSCVLFPLFPSPNSLQSGSFYHGIYMTPVTGVSEQVTVCNNTWCRSSVLPALWMTDL